MVSWSAAWAMLSSLLGFYGCIQVGRVNQADVKDLGAPDFWVLPLLFLGLGWEHPLLSVFLLKEGCIRDCTPPQCLWQPARICLLALGLEC